MRRSRVCIALLAWASVACSSDEKRTDTTRPAQPATATPDVADVRAPASSGQEPPQPDPTADHDAEPEPPASETDAMPARMRCLVESYPDHLCGGDASHVRWCDGRLMAWDDGQDKADFDALLDRADLEDQMSQVYRAGPDYQVPIPVDFNPGRIRHTPFFLRMYGETESRVRETLTHITWLPGSANRRIRVTTVNGVHDKLEAVSRDIEKLPPELVRAVAQSSGPFYWRDIKGTTRKSMHSFAIAFDVGLDHAYYWRWSKPEADGTYAYKNAMPMEIVEIFERHGFIWGGKWYHYDTPHFEYRPELLHPDCVAR